MFEAISAEPIFSTSSRIAAHTSCASSGVATLPVPIAHTGSYAITIFFSSGFVNHSRPARTWRITWLTCAPDSRIANSSPTQKIGIISLARAALILRLISASDSA